MTNAFENFYTDMLQEQPQMAYQGAVTSQFPQFDLMSRPQKRQRDYWSDQYSNIHNQYLGQQGEGLAALAQGRQPTTPMGTFSQYLENIPFTQRYASLTPQQRGQGTRSFAPSTRYLFF